MASAIDEGPGSRISARSLPPSSERPVVEHHIPLQGPSERQVVAALSDSAPSGRICGVPRALPRHMECSFFRSGSSGCIRPLQQCRFRPEPQAGRVPEDRACVRSDPEAGLDVDQRDRRSYHRCWHGRSELSDRTSPISQASPVESCEGARCHRACLEAVRDRVSAGQHFQVMAGN